MLDFLVYFSGHIQAILEASTLTEEDLITLHSAGWSACCSSCHCFTILARGPRTTVHWLYDSGSNGGTKKVPFFIAEVDFGLQDAKEYSLHEGRIIRRAGLQQVRVCVVHIGATPARTKCASVRVELEELF
jgi:hypothetical protein